MLPHKSLCDVCKRNTATVFVTRMVQNHSNKQRLCQYCAQRNASENNWSKSLAPKIGEGSVPRNIAPEVANLQDVFLYGVDDLRYVAEQGQNARQLAAIAAEAAIDNHVHEFMAWLRARERFEPILALRERSHAARDLALAQAKRRLAAGGNSVEILERLAHQLTNQMLHAPTVALRDAGAAGDDALIASAVKLMRLDR